MVPLSFFHCGRLGSARFHNLVGFVGAGIGKLRCRWSYDMRIAHNTPLNKGGGVSVVVSAKVQISIETKRSRNVGIVKA